MLARFFSPQNSMNLPPDKARLLRQYDNEKKWDLICDQVRSEKSCFLHTPVNSSCTFSASVSTIMTVFSALCVLRRGFR